MRLGEGRGCLRIKERVSSGGKIVSMALISVVGDL